MPDTETKFINSLFLKNLIENLFEENNVQVKKFSIEKGSLNETIRSSLSKIIIKFTSQESIDGRLTLIAKIKPTTGELTEEYKKCDIFDKEIFIYKRILPNFVDILKKVGGKVEIAPMLLYSAEVPSDVLIFEDLTSRNYQAQNPQIGLNLDQSLMAVEKLAFFHAASVIMINENPSNFGKFHKGTFHESNRMSLKYFQESFKNFIESANNLDLDNEIIEKLKTLSPKLIEKGIEDYNSNINGFQVLNHGDFWTGNLLYRYDDKELIDVMFIDFQNSVIGSPIIDLIYFLTTSVNYEIRKCERDEIIFTYHETLSILLKKLNYRGYIPTLNELQIELIKRGALECIYALTTAPYLRTNNSNILPEIQPAIYNKSNTDKTVTKTVIDLHKSGLKCQIQRLDSLGLLDWGAAPSKIRGLMGKFQH